jgi:hypothetical protein
MRFQRTATAKAMADRTTAIRRCFSQGRCMGHRSASIARPHCARLRHLHARSRAAYTRATRRALPLQPLTGRPAPAAMPTVEHFRSCPRPCEAA